jgi:integrase
VQAVTSRDIETFQRAVAAGKSAKREKLNKARALSNRRGGKGAASRTVGLLGAIFGYAVKEGMRTDNPVRGVVRYADGKKDRRLFDDEYKALGAALLALAEGEDAMWPAAIAAIKFLAFTGWRSGEVVHLTRGMVDLAKRLAVIDSKSGTSVRPLSQEAVGVLRTLGNGNAETLFFPPTRGGGVMSGFPSFFDCATEKAGLDKSGIF